MSTRAITISLIISLSCFSISAQRNIISVSGYVKDTKGQKLTNVKVTIKQLAIDPVYTDRNGLYLFDNVRGLENVDVLEASFEKEDYEIADTTVQLGNNGRIKDMVLIKSQRFGINLNIIDELTGKEIEKVSGRIIGMGIPLESEPIAGNYFLELPRNINRYKEFEVQLIKRNRYYDTVINLKYTEKLVRIKMKPLTGDKGFERLKSNFLHLYEKTLNPENTDYQTFLENYKELNQFRGHASELNRKSNRYDPHSEEIGKELNKVFSGNKSDWNQYMKPLDDLYDFFNRKNEAANLYKEKSDITSFYIEKLRNQPNSNGNNIENSLAYVRSIYESFWKIIEVDQQLEEKGLYNVCLELRSPIGQSFAQLQIFFGDIAKNEELPEEFRNRLLEIVNEQLKQFNQRFKSCQ